MIPVAIVGAVGALLVAAAIYDFRTLRIPNWISLSVFLLYLAFLAAQELLSVPAAPLPLWSSLAVGAGVAAVFAGLFALNLLGGGDVKLVAALGFWAGPYQILPFFLVMAVAGGVLALGYLVLSRRRTPGRAGTGADSSKNERKQMKIPYGIAIAVAGLFVVNNILTFLLA